MNNFFIFSVFVISLISFVSSALYKSNITDLAKCNVSYSRTGSTYKDFYPIPTHENGNGSLTLDFHFAVLATSDAHILLTETENANKSDPAYEIVIGAGGNTFCDIRRMQKSEVKQSVRIKGLLSALDPHFFWIHITKEEAGGRIEVGREGDNTSFIAWLDPAPLPVKFISFSTWSEIEAKWYFDCDRSQNLEEIEKRLTPLDMLRRNLLLVSLYDPMVRPVSYQSTVTTVYVSLNLEYLELDEYKSSIEIQGTTTMKWHDEKLHWNPLKYDNVSVMHADQTEIWKPNIKCHSGADNPTNVLQDAMIVVNYTGEVIWKPSIHVKALCDGVQLTDWPRDTHFCKILFGFPMSSGNILLHFNDSGSSLLQHGSSQWLILDAAVFDIDSDNETSDSPSFGLYFEVKRSSAIYSIIFFTPFIVIATCLLLSFWIPPNRHMKVSMGCAQLIMGIIMLLALAYFVPHSSGGVPFLVVLYSGCLVSSLLSLLISIIIINISRKKQSKPLPHAICNILAAKYVKAALCLPSIGIAEDYGDLDISLSCSNVSRTEDKGQQFWILLVIAIDRLSFLLYTPVIIILIIKYILSCF